MKKIRTFVIVLLSCAGTLNGQLKPLASLDTICGHKTHWDGQGRILSWYQPHVQGAGYAHVAKLASEFIKWGTPTDSATGLKLYYISCCFQGPHMRTPDDFRRGRTWEHWMHNPACVFAGLVQSLVVDFRVFSGDSAYIDVVGAMLDHMLENGTTPSHWEWPDVPFASSNPGERAYQGATEWEKEGMRGDGLHGIEPDKVGELGFGYLRFYEAAGREKYLEAAIRCADALAGHVRDIPGDLAPFTGAEVVRSPWPFRVNARTGAVISEYCSNVSDPLRLLNELLRIGARIGLDSSRVSVYRKARDTARRWLFSKSGPMKTFIWNAYFEDIPNDPERSNRLQITPLETARTLIQHPELDPDLDKDVPALIHWVASAFKTDGMDAIREQTWCYEPMGSHTARYASLCALWHERTGDPWYRDQAFRFFNFATYMTYENGVVAVGPNWPGSWFSDGYGDYIRHFMAGMAAVPEWAPAGEDHLLSSTSVVRRILYRSGKIEFTTFDPEAETTLRLTFKPASVRVNGNPLRERKDLKGPGWTWRPLGRDCVLRIRHANGTDVLIQK
jgi:hypothetical protein